MAIAAALRAPGLHRRAQRHLPAPPRPHGRRAAQRSASKCDAPKASLYVWAKLPAGVTSAEYAARLIEDCSVVVTPGRGYGQNGEGYIRLSVTTPDDRMEEGLKRLEAWKGL